MKMTFRLLASVTDDDSDAPVSPPQSLDGRIYEDICLGNYLDEEIAELGIIGGSIRFAVVEGTAQILVDYWSPIFPDNTVLNALKEDTASQMSDGAGEGGFAFTEHGRQFRITADLDHSIAIELVDDGKKVPPVSRIATAARSGDFKLLQKILAVGGEEIDALYLGYTGLHLAILGGHVDAALTLITHGADPNRRDPLNDTPLSLCASSNQLLDASAARVAQALLSRGADPTLVDDTGWSARKLAELRGKAVLAALLPVVD